MIKKKRLVDRMITPEGSPLYSEDEQEIVVSGKLGIGNNGHPVSIVVEDEVTGETLEVNNVNKALLVIEDTRQTSNGWMSLAVGDIDKLGEVLQFLAKMTLTGLKKMVKG